MQAQQSYVTFKEPPHRTVSGASVGGGDGRPFDPSNTDKAESMEGAAIRIIPKKWVGERKVECQVYAEQPKQDLIHEGTMTFTLSELKVTAE